MQARNIDTPGDLSVVNVDLRDANILIPAGGNFAVVAALQFPQFDGNVAVGVGPAIAIDADLPDQDCDFFTIDGGQDPLNSWWVPDGLDWGFVVFVEPALPVSPLSWTRVKMLYRTP